MSHDHFLKFSNFQNCDTHLFEYCNNVETYEKLGIMLVNVDAKVQFAPF